MKTRVLALIILILIPISTAKGNENEFQFEISCNLEGYYQNVQIGYSEQASTSFDQTYDTIAPPEPPIGVRAYLEHQSPNPLFTKLTKSIVNPQTSYQWLFKIESKGVTGQLNISWTNTPENMIITLNDGTNQQEINGKGEILLDVQSGTTIIYNIQVQTRYQPPVTPPVITSPPEETPDPDPITQPEDPTPPEEPEMNTTEPIIPQLNQTEPAEEQPEENQTTSITPPSTETQENNISPQLKNVEIKELSIKPNPASTNEEITLTIKLYNPENTSQQYTATIYIDAEMVQAKTITIQSKTKKELTHTFSMTAPGDHTIQVNEEYQRFTVKTASPIPFSLIPAIIGITLALKKKRSQVSEPISDST